MEEDRLYEQLQVWAAFGHPSQTPVDTTEEAQVSEHWWQWSQTEKLLSSQTAHTSHTFLFLSERLQPFLLSLFICQSGCGKQLYKWQSWKKNVILDNLCSELIIAGKNNWFSSLCFHNSQTASFQDIILLVCFAGIVTLVFFSQGQFVVYQEEYLPLGFFRSVPLYLHQIIFDKGCKRPLNLTS